MFLLIPHKFSFNFHIIEAREQKQLESPSTKIVLSRKSTPKATVLRPLLSKGDNLQRLRKQNSRRHINKIDKIFSNSLSKIQEEANEGSGYSLKKPSSSNVIIDIDAPEHQPIPEVVQKLQMKTQKTKI